MTNRAPLRRIVATYAASIFYPSDYQDDLLECGHWTAKPTNRRAERRRCQVCASLPSLHPSEQERIANRAAWDLAHNVYPTT